MLKGHVTKARGRHNRAGTTEAVGLQVGRQVADELDVVAGAGRDGDFHGKRYIGVQWGLVEHNLLFLIEF
jgi:hypothetical protein